MELVRFSKLHSLLIHKQQLLIPKTKQYGKNNRSKSSV
jgi:hypothetical protein